MSQSSGPQQAPGLLLSAAALLPIADDVEWAATRLRWLLLSAAAPALPEPDRLALAGAAESAALLHRALEALALGAKASD